MKYLILTMFLLFSGCEANNDKHKDKVKVIWEDKYIEKLCIEGYVYYKYIGSARGGLAQAFNMDGGYGDTIAKPTRCK